MMPLDAAAAVAELAADVLMAVLNAADPEAEVLRLRVKLFSDTEDNINDDLEEYANDRL